MRQPSDELLAMERLLGPDPHVEPTPADSLRIQAIMLQAGRADGGGRAE
jgi:hypothetical protein